MTVGVTEFARFMIGRRWKLMVKALGGTVNAGPTP